MQCSRTCRRINGIQALVWALVFATLPALAAYGQQKAVSGWVDPPVVQSIAGNQSMPYALFIPETSKGALYPLVLHLHGSTGAKDALRHDAGLLKVLPKPEWQAQRPCFILAPTCPENNEQPKWANTPWSNGSYSIEKVPVSVSMQLAMAALDDVCKKYPIDRNRIYIAGGSMGGYGTWDAICRYPQLFACAMPVSGGGDPTCAGRLKNLPIHAFAIATDSVCPVRGSREMIEAIKTAGGHPLYTEYPKGWHMWDQCWDPDNKEYYQAGVLEWCFDQTKDSTAVHVRTSVVGQGTLLPKSVGWIYAKGTTLQVTAKAADGWEFSAWGGDAGGKTNPLNVVLTKNMTLSAVFVQTTPAR